MLLLWSSCDAYLFRSEPTFCDKYIVIWWFSNQINWSPDVVSLVARAARYNAETSTSYIPGNFIVKANSATTSDTTTTLLAITE